MEKNIIKEMEYLDNIFQKEHMPGDAPSLLLKKGVDVIICQNMGRRALQMFSDHGVAVITGAEGKVREILRRYSKGELVSKRISSSE